MIEEYKEMIQRDIDLLGYSALRYSLFAGRNNNRAEYQARIEFIDGHFEVYMTGERASVSGSKKYDDFFQAYKDFMYRIQSRVITNRKSVRNNELPEYPCPLWDNEKAE
ncbi:Imm59 family immunity protein [Listeria kieliensis]|uniref:Imm59 family immunity protein n=1 Tax=Listeria kieliensis TaxID=1621700 RepID=UPI000E2161D8|nr:Imm59 family immunity protein [Listeria kieliensis]